MPSEPKKPDAIDRLRKAIAEQKADNIAAVVSFLKPRPKSQSLN